MATLAAAIENLSSLSPKKNLFLPPLQLLSYAPLDSNASPVEARLISNRTALTTTADTAEKMPQDTGSGIANSPRIDAF